MEPTPSAGWLIGIFAVALFSGCIDGAPPEATMDPHRALSLACPDGAVWRPTPDVCAGTIGDGSRVVADPSIAVSPHDLNVIVVAANSFRSQNTLPGTGYVPGNAESLEQEAIYVSRDRGQSWYVYGAPQVGGTAGLIGGARFAGDASVAIDRNGTLHMSALTTDGGVFYARSPTLGREWEAVTALANGGADRSWLSLEAGKIFVAWHDTVAHATRVAVSKAGDSWESMVGGAGIANCVGNSPVVDGVIGPIVACQDPTSGAVGVYALRSEPVKLVMLGDATGDIRLVSAGTTKTLAYQTVGDGGPTLGVWRANDGGVRWSQLPDVRGASTLMANWDWMTLSALQADPTGGLHLLVIGGAGENCALGDCEDADARRHVVHINLGPMGELLAEHLLTPAGGAHREEARGDGPFQDDVHGIVFSDDGGWMAWGHDGAVDFTRLLL